MPSRLSKSPGERSISKMLVGDRTIDEESPTPLMSQAVPIEGCEVVQLTETRVSVGKTTRIVGVMVNLGAAIANKVNRSSSMTLINVV